MRASHKVPQGWVLAQLDDVVEVLDRFRVPVNSTERAKRPGTVPYYGATGQVGTIDDFLFDEELVLLGEDGAPFLDNTKDKAYMIRGKAWVNNHAHVLRGRPGILNTFLMHQLNVIDYHPYVSGSTRLKLPQAPMVTIPMVLAPEPEQRRIVEAIEEQFTRLDAAVAGLKRVQRELKRYRASVLKAACEGRLVPTEAELARAEGRELEPADRLLTRILEKRLVRGGAKYKEPTPPDLTSLPAPPDGWFWTTMDVVTVLLRNGYGKMPDANTGTRILRISAVRPRALNINDVRFLSGSTEDYTQYLVKPGDVLFTRYNGNADLVGVCATVRSVPEPTVHPDKLIRCELLSEFCLPQFIEIAANVGASRDHMARRVRTTAGQSGISGPDIRTMPIPLPPLAEQERIVAEVERRLSVVEKAEAAVEANMKRAERMRQAILRRAFEGKLVPQDPTDEPASVLLERIRAERAVSAVNGRGKRGKKGSGQLELPGLPSPPAPLSRARERGSLTRP